MWHMLFGEDHAPSMEQISEFIGSGRKRWELLNEYLQSTYQIQPIIEYSSCSAQPGWNVKYRKKSKGLCTLYPLRDSFIVLVVVSPKQDEQVSFGMESGHFSAHVKTIFSQARPMAMGRWLMIEAVDDAVLEDIKSLISLRQIV